MVSYTFLGNPPPNVQEWIQKTYLTIYKVETTSSYKKTGIYSAQRDDASKPVVIDWGDGVVEEIDGDVSQKPHEYSNVGEFTVKVRNIKSFAASADNYVWYGATSQNKYTFKELVNLNKAVTSIGSDAFDGCSGLMSVTIPDSVMSIGDRAFLYCTSLTSVTIPDSVTSIESHVFGGCSGLTSVMIPDSVTSIGYEAFCNCSGLMSVTIPDSVTSIGDSAFDGCSGLASVAIGNSVTSIGNYAFVGCSSLTSVTIPDSVTSIGDEAFSNCEGLVGVNITDIAKWCSILFSNVNSNPLYYAHNLYLNDVKVTDLVIPAGTVSIGNYAFVGCNSLTSVTIPDGVTSIGGYAFDGCTGLTSVTIPNSVTSIGRDAFYGCSGLTSVTFDSTAVPTGNWGCFYDTSSLTDVYMLNISEAGVQAQLDSNISTWQLGVDSSGYHTVTIHCMNGNVVIDPTSSGSS